MTKRNFYIILSFLLLNGIYLMLHFGHFFLVYLGISGFYPILLLNGVFLVSVSFFKHFPKILRTISNILALSFITIFLVCFMVVSLFGPTYLTLESKNGDLKVTVEYTDSSFLDIHLGMNLYETTGFFAHKLNEDKIDVMVIMNQADGRPSSFFLGLEGAYWTEDSQIHLPVWRNEVTLNVSRSSSITGGEPLHIQ
ncbi:hypothetical protein AZF04_00985 [Alkalihalobacillus trypoxylicola]|uniref:Uncharacterized protein n=1 Tax=Alkalihalobacillus trypoxylicola TaxID=519424 RepID=A0A162F700_9BACI|nr:hypothetical protein AZF04_00985 [Alkalihalobacillus trypoxylicola]